MVVEFKNSNEGTFNEWLEIEQKGRDIEIGELSEIQGIVFKFLQSKTDVTSHMALVTAWMDMRTEIRKRILGFPDLDLSLVRQSRQGQVPVVTPSALILKLPVRKPPLLDAHRAERRQAHPTAVGPLLGGEVAGPETTSCERKKGKEAKSDEISC